MGGTGGPSDSPSLGSSKSSSKSGVFSALFLTYIVYLTGGGVGLFFLPSFTGGEITVIDSSSSTESWNINLSSFYFRRAGGFGRFEDGLTFTD